MATVLKTMNNSIPDENGITTPVILFLARDQQSAGSVGVVKQIEDSSLGHKQYEVSAINLIDNKTPIEDQQGLKVIQSLTTNGDIMKVIKDGDSFKTEVVKSAPHVAEMELMFNKDDIVSFSKQSDGTFIMTKIDNELVDFSL